MEYAPPAQYIEAPQYAPQYFEQQPLVIEEEEEETFTYSRFALPWLIFSLIILLSVFSLTFWQQTGSMKNWFDGTPRVLQRAAVDAMKEDAGLKKSLRNTRIAEMFFGFIGIATAFLVFFARPQRKIASAFNFGVAGLLFFCSILAWIAFGLGLDQYKKAVECEENYLQTGADCRNRQVFSIAAVALDAAVGLGSLTAAVLLAWNTKAGHWRLPARAGEELIDDDVPQKERVPGEVVLRNVGYVRRWLVGLSLVFTLLFIFALAAFVIVLHEHRETVFVRGSRGRADSSLNPFSDKPFEHAGWPTLNTRIRYAASAIGIVAVVFNFLPFTNRTVAYVLGFLYFTSATILIIAFGFDVHKLRKVHKISCPFGDNGERLVCHKSSFVGTAFLEFFAALALFVYLIYEYYVKEKCAAATRAFAAQSQQKTVVAVKAPVDTAVGACQFCGDTFQGKVNEHQAVCPELPVECQGCGDKLQRFKLDKHAAEECPQRSVSCSSCGQGMPFFRLGRHQAAGCQ